MKVLVVDVGGSHVKFKSSDIAEPRRFKSGPTLTPTDLVDRVREATGDWHYDVISLGYPGRVATDAPSGEPGNLGNGWLNFDFAAAFGKPVRLVNDAVMQALGGYTGGRMLYLGLGTGLGSALVTEHVIVPMELGNLPTPAGGILGDAIGTKGLKASGPHAWLALVTQTITTLRAAMLADYTLVGGGNAKLVDPLPPQTRRGGNEDAFRGGFRLWEEFVEPHDREPARNWRVVR
jgi:polyphosphate glucokinase